WQARAGELEAALRESTGRLSAARRRAAGALAAEVSRLLPHLGMPDGVFEVSLEEVAEMSRHGAEAVEFRVTVNRGFEPRPLAKVASGGELSRVMLALKTILARVDRIPALVFDEIDAGIGGVVGAKIGEKLAEVSSAHQVFVITHLAQIAARADHHLLVTKSSAGERARAVVRGVSGEERVRELARMLGGDPESAASLEHARELLAGVERAAESTGEDPTGTGGRRPATPRTRAHDRRRTSSSGN
ncbi:MAG: DNA repair protein RecN, partial [Gemmatimonadota bacterium]